MESWKQPTLSETQKKKRRGSYGPSRYEWRIQIKHKPSGKTPKNWDSVGGGDNEVLIIEYSDDDYMKTIVSVMTMIIFMKIIMINDYADNGVDDDYMIASQSARGSTCNNSARGCQLFLFKLGCY